MEVVYSGGSGTKPPKLKSFTGDISPINGPLIGRGGGGRYLPVPISPIFDPYACSDSPNSPLIRYLCSGSSTRRSPLASMENLMDSTPPRSPAVFKTPVDVGEDVLVMDGILVSSKSNSSSRLRSMQTSSSTSGGRSSISSSSSVGSGGGKENERTETCRSWEESGSCRIGAKSLFVHGKEEQRPNLTTRSQSKNPTEAQICKAYSAGSCTYGTKCRFVHLQVKSTIPSAQPQVQPSPIEMSLPATPENVYPVKYSKQQPSTGSSGSRSSTKTGFVNSDWSPMDDSIEIAIPSSYSTETKASREDIDLHILSILYGPARRKRLPVFTEFCPE